MIAPTSASSFCSSPVRLCDGNSACVTSTFLRPISLRRLHEREDLLPAQMAGRQDHVVLRDPLQAALGRVDQLPCVVDDRERRRRDAFGRELALDLRPERQLLGAAVEPAGGFVLRVDGRHPDDLAAATVPASSTATGFKPADAVVQRDGAERLDAGDGLGDDLRALAGLHVVRFQDEALHPVRQEFLRAVDVVDRGGQSRRGRRGSAGRRRLPGISRRRR